VAKYFSHYINLKFFATVAVMLRLFSFEPGISSHEKGNQNKVQPNGLFLKNGKYHYRVRKDEFLDFIATRFFGTKKAVRKIIRWNHIADPSKVFVGKILKFEEPPQNLALEDSQRALFTALARKFKLNQKWIDDALSASLKRQEPAASQKVEKELAATNPGENSKTNDQIPKSHTQPDVKDAKISTNLLELDGFWKASLDALDAKTLLSIGERLNQEQKFAAAARYLRSARTSQPQLGKSWLLEFMSLQACGWNDDALVTKTSFVASNAPSEIKDPLVLKMNENAPGPKDKCLSAELKIEDLSAEEHLLAGEALFAKSEKAFALIHLKESRSKDDKLVKAWILEIRCEKDLQKTEEANATIEAFKARHPNLSGLPFLRR
jgi:hypothetical protein